MQTLNSLGVYGTALREGVTEALRGFYGMTLVEGGAAAAIHLGNVNC